MPSYSKYSTNKEVVETKCKYTEPCTSYGIPSFFQKSMMLLNTTKGLISKMNLIKDSYVSYLGCIFLSRG